MGRVEELRLPRGEPRHLINRPVVKPDNCRSVPRPSGTELAQKSKLGHYPGLRFELLGRTVTQGGMQALLIVVPFDELLDVIIQVLQILVLVGIDFLPSEF